MGPDLLLYIAAGVLIGTFAGLLPGVGVFVSLMALYPLLMDMSIIHLLVMYIAIVSSTQYIGSVSATLFGIPGEASSLPAVREGHKLYMRGQGAYAISSCAIGSFIGSMLSVIMFYLLLDYVFQIYHFYDTQTQAIFLVIVTTIVVLISNRWWVGILLAGFGYFLGRIGGHVLDPNSTFLTFDNPDLIFGLPTFSVMFALYVIPELLKGYEISKNQKQVDTVKLEKQKLKDHLYNWYKTGGSSIRGTIIGFFGGLTPGLTTIISSNLSYSVEIWLNKRKGQYREDGDLKCLTSAETANNAGAFSCLLPLLILGIPIIPSEAVLFDLADAKGYAFGFENFTPELFLTVAISLVVINFICLIIAWPLVRYFGIFGKIPLKWLNILIIIILIGTLLMVGSQTWQSWYYLWTFLALVPVGYLLRKVNTLPIVFAFILQPRFEAVFTRLPELIQLPFI